LTSFQETRARPAPVKTRKNSSPKEQVTRRNAAQKKKKKKEAQMAQGMRKGKQKRKGDHNRRSKSHTAIRVSSKK